MYQYAGSGADVTVEDAFSFAQHMSIEGKKLLAKAQAPGVSILQQEKALFPKRTTMNIIVMRLQPTE